MVDSSGTRLLVNYCTCRWMYRFIDAVDVSFVFLLPFLCMCLYTVVCVYVCTRLPEVGVNGISTQKPSLCSFLYNY